MRPGISHHLKHLLSRGGLRLLPTLLLLLPGGAFASTNLHTSFLWHLHQPIYWPDRRNYGGDHYEAAWDTIQQQNAGSSPSFARSSRFQSIFGLSGNRVAAYQNGPHDTVNSLLSYPNAGAQVNYSE